MNLDKFCQSCMIPKDHEMFQQATENDGSKSDLYCSLCYDQGHFLSPEISTAKEMQEFLKGILKEQGIGRLKRWFYTVSIPQLKRWK